MNYFTEWEHGSDHVNDQKSLESINFKEHK